MRKCELRRFYSPEITALLLLLKKMNKCVHPVATVTPFKWLVDGEYVTGHICEICLAAVQTWEERKDS